MRCVCQNPESSPQLPACMALQPVRGPRGPPLSLPPTGSPCAHIKCLGSQNRVGLAGREIPYSSCTQDKFCPPHLSVQPLETSAPCQPTDLAKSDLSCCDGTYTCTRSLQNSLTKWREPSDWWSWALARSSPSLPSLQTAPGMGSSSSSARSAWMRAGCKHGEPLQNAARRENDNAFCCPACAAAFVPSAKRIWDARVPAASGSLGLPGQPES